MGTVLHNECELLRLMAEGDERAFCRIFDHYRDKLYTFALHLIKDEALAEEVVQDIFLKIWMNRSSLTGVNSFNSYLYIMARNRALNCLKRMAHEELIIKELSLTMSEIQCITEETVTRNEYQYLIDQLVNKLPPRQKLIYILSRNEGMKYQDIAVELNLSRNTVKAHLKKALSTLRAVLSSKVGFLVTCIAGLLE